jgi:hypothetical protein
MQTEEICGKMRAKFFSDDKNIENFKTARYEGFHIALESA